MFNIGNAILGEKPAVVVCLKDGISRARFAQIKKMGLDIAELRIDQFSSDDPAYVLEQIKRIGNIPKIATIRSKKEGGFWKASEADRLNLYRAVIPHVDAVDLELSSSKILRKVIRAARARKKWVIVSYHNFQATPPAVLLTQVIRKAKKAGADIVKIATMIRTIKDFQTLARITVSHSGQNLITIGMGEAGKISRIFLPRLGSLMVYCSPDGNTAPGQFTQKETTAFIKKYYL